MVGRAGNFEGRGCLKAQAVNSHLTSFVALQTHIQGRRTHNHVPILVQQHLVSRARVQEPELGHVRHWILHHVIAPSLSTEQEYCRVLHQDMCAICHTYITAVAQNSIE